MKYILNNVFLSDCLSFMKKIEDETVDVIYLDPPFFSQTTQKLSTKNNKINSFDDRWDTVSDYIYFLKIRFIEMKRILKKEGTIFVHCDKFASHYIRVLLDEIFGYNNFINEIIWSFKKWSNSKNGLQNNHQNIFWYSKSSKFIFNEVYTDYSPTTNIDQILLKRKRDITTNKAIYTDETVNHKKGVLLGDIWEIPFLNPKAKERVNYPTQKPIILLEKILEISTNKNSIVFDPFCGSGTTLVTSKLMGRNFIGCDILENAVNIASDRLEKLIKTESNLMKKGKLSYVTKSDKLDILNKINAKVIYRSKKADGLLNTIDGLLSVKILIKEENIDDAIINIKSFNLTKGINKSIIITNKKGDKSLLNMDNYKNIEFYNEDEIVNINKLYKHNYG